MSSKSDEKDAVTYKATASANRDILVSKKKSDKAPKKVTEVQPVLSKSVLRKMAKIAREKGSKKDRLHSLEILQEHQFDGDKRVLFQQSGTIGTTRTHAEELARLYGLKQAGVELSNEDNRVLNEALVDFGDLDQNTMYAEKKKQSMSSHAFKTVTANPFMPLSTASATINATIQDRLVGKAQDRKIYSSKELASIAENMTVTDFDASYKKKLKKRQRREEHALVNQKLKELNAKKIHEAVKDIENGVADEDIFKPEQFVILPKELRGLSQVITEQSGGKVKAITSNVSGGQMHKPKAHIVANVSETDDGFRAAAHLISKGLLTTKSKDKIDALFAMDDFSDDDDAETDSDNDDNNNQSKKNSIDEDLWGVTSSEDKQKEKLKKQQKHLQQQKALAATKAAKEKAAALSQDEFSSAASAAKGAYGPVVPAINIAGDTEDITTTASSARLPASLAMPTITRTNKAAVVSKTLPVAVLGGDIPPIIIKRQKGNNQDTATTNNTSGQLNQNQLVQLQQKEAEYSVKFQVLKSRQVRNFLQSIHEGTNADMSDAEDENTYTQDMPSNNPLSDIYGNNNNNNQTQVEEEKPKKRKVLFDFTGPITVPAPAARSTLVIDNSTLMADEKEEKKPAKPVKKALVKKTKADPTVTTQSTSSVVKKDDSKVAATTKKVAAPDVTDSKASKTKKSKILDQIIASDDDDGDDDQDDDAVKETNPPAKSTQKNTQIAKKTLTKPTTVATKVTASTPTPTTKTKTVEGTKAAANSAKISEKTPSVTKTIEKTSTAKPTPTTTKAATSVKAKVIAKSSTPVNPNAFVGKKKQQKE